MAEMQLMINALQAQLAVADAHTAKLPAVPEGVPEATTKGVTSAVVPEPVPEATTKGAKSAVVPEASPKATDIMTPNVKEEGWCENLDKSPGRGAEGGNADDDAPESRSLLPQSPLSPATAQIALPPNVAEPVFASAADRAKAWAKYDRSLCIGPSKAGVATSDTRAKRGDKATPEFLCQIAGAFEKSFYFAVWMGCGQKWANVRVFV